MEIEVYALRLSRALKKAEVRDLQQKLPAERQARLQRTRADKQDQILCAYGLLAYALRGHGWAKLPDIALTPEGKPWFPQAPQMCFNLSHTDGAVICALHDRQVGVDVERRRQPPARLIKRYTIENEEEFWALWVKREAVAKCQGNGIGALLRWDTRREENVHCTVFSPFPGVYAALASEELRASYRLREVTLEELFDRG